MQTILEILILNVMNFLKKEVSHFIMEDLVFRLKNLWVIRKPTRKMLQLNMIPFYKRSSKNVKSLLEKSITT